MGNQTKKAIKIIKNSLYGSFGSNNNGRIYTKEVFMREIERYEKDMLERKRKEKIELRNKKLKRILKDGETN